MAKKQTPLAPLTAGTARAQAMLDASQAIITLFLSQRTSDFSVKELAAHAGLSERTFYRYFPRKEDVIRPYIDALLVRTVADVRAYPRSRPLPEALIAGHARLYQEDAGSGWDALLSVVAETDSLRAVWLQVLTDAEDHFVPVVAERMKLPPGSPRVRLIAAVIVTAGRLALERASGPSSDRDRAPADIFADCLDMIGPELFQGAT